MNRLGSYLRDRRERLDPLALGLPMARRRTPGLRREEVAQRANVSATWYTWLEQGRGGAPSADVLDRIAKAMLLTDMEREHVYLLALGRAPDVRFKPPEGITPRLQRVLQAFECCPAILRSPIWDVLGWNRAAEAVLGTYDTVPMDQRNLLRRLFCDPENRLRQVDWDASARFVVAAFRADVARAAATEKAQALIDDLCRISPEFARLWRDNDVRGGYGEMAKQVRHPVAGLIALEYSTFAVDGRPDLSLVVYNPATPADLAKVRALIGP
jgi:transcriptional regulator with XRE-family HTH domain